MVTRNESKVRMGRGGLLRLSSALLSLLTTTGCSLPIAEQVYTPTPVRGARASVVVREVHRGTVGTVLVLAITNEADELLEWACGGKVRLQLKDGRSLTSLALPQYQYLVDCHGPIAMGFAEWRAEAVPVLLDPLGARINLHKGQEGVLCVAFELPRDQQWVLLDLSGALQWRDGQGRAVVDAKPFPLALEIPPAPKQHGLTKDSFRHVQVSVSAAGGF